MKDILKMKTKLVERRLVIKSAYFSYTYCGRRHTDGAIHLMDGQLSISNSSGEGPWWTIIITDDNTLVYRSDIGGGLTVITPDAKHAREALAALPKHFAVTVEVQKIINEGFIRLNHGGYNRTTPIVKESEADQKVRTVQEFSDSLLHWHRLSSLNNKDSIFTKQLKKVKMDLKKFVASL